MIDLKNFLKELELEVAVAPKNDELDIVEASLNRPALQLTGFWEFFGYKRPQLLGRGEIKFLEMLSDDVRSETLKKFFSYSMPCVIICRDYKPTEEMKRLAEENNVPVFLSKKATDRFEVELLMYLNRVLAPSETIHGVLVDVNGAGLLITGKSGAGKSEAALELIRRGHRLVADDVVYIRRVSDDQLVGESPELVRNFMEIRGVGIIDVSVMYGISAMLDKKSIDLVVNLVLLDDTANCDRLGLTEDFENLLGIQIPKLVLPVQPGRNLGVVLEAAVSNFRLKQNGRNAAAELMRRQNMKIK